MSTLSRFEELRAQAIAAYAAADASPQDGIGAAKGGGRVRDNNSILNAAIEKVTAQFILWDYQANGTPLPDGFEEPTPMFNKNKWGFWEVKLVYSGKPVTKKPMQCRKDFASVGETLELIRAGLNPESGEVDIQEAGIMTSRYRGTGDPKCTKTLKQLLKLGTGAGREMVGRDKSVATPDNGNAALAAAGTSAPVAVPVAAVAPAPAPSTIVSPLAVSPVQTPVAAFVEAANPAALTPSNTAAPATPPSPAAPSAPPRAPSAPSASPPPAQAKAK